MLHFTLRCYFSFRFS